MRDQELKDIWKNPSRMEHISINKKQLLTQLNKKMKEIDNNIKKRDIRETVASIIGIIIFAVLGWDIPFFWSKVACGIAIAWFAFVIYRLKKQRQNEEPDVTLPYSEQLEQRKEYLKGQSHMLDTAVYWYVLPPFVMNVIFFLGAGNPSEWDNFFASALPEGIIEKVVILSLLAVFYAYIAWINKKASRDHYEPLIREIEHTQAELEHHG